LVKIIAKCIKDVIFYLSYLYPRLVTEPVRVKSLFVLMISQTRTFVYKMVSINILLQP